MRTSYKDEMRNSPHSAGYSRNFNSATQSPDGTQNYLLRANSSDPAFPVTGTNTANVVDSTSTTAILPGVGLYTITPNEAPDFVTQVNFTIEQPLKGNSALRISWLWTHGTNLDQEFNYNNHYSAIAWELKTGTATPQGKIIGQPDYAATALGPYDQTVWGGRPWTRRAAGRTTTNSRSTTRGSSTTASRIRSSMTGPSPSELAATTSVTVSLIPR